MRKVWNLMLLLILCTCSLAWSEISSSAVSASKLPQSRIDNFVKCAQWCKIECVKQCIEVVGHDPNSRNSQYGTTPLMAAVGCGPAETRLELVKYLIEHGADVNAEDKDGDNVVHKACYSPDYRVFQYLLNSGMNAKARNSIGSTALHVLALHEIQGNEVILDTLLSIGIDINDTGGAGSTPLMVATNSQLTYNVKAFLDRGADPRLIGEFGRTALMDACYYGPDSASLLLSQADSPLDVQDNKGRTALMYAMMKTRFKTMEVLLAKGADTSLKCNEGKTALDYLPTWLKDDEKEKVKKMFAEAGKERKGADGESK